MSKSKLLKDFVQFSCTKCGKCCKGRTNVFVNVAEVEALSALKGMDKFNFVKTYTEDKETSSGILTSLKTNVDKNGNQSCIFLKDNQCSVYDARPTQCRTYPFWPLHLIGEAEWKAEARNCEGITVSKPKDEQPVNVIPANDVLSNMIVHMVHDRGLGPAWTYEESLSNLNDTQAQDPRTIAEFENDYFSTHHSSIVFENHNIIVVDTTTPEASAATAEDDDDDEVDLDDIDDLDDDALADTDNFLNELTKPTLTTTLTSKPKAVNTFRRLEFVSLPSVTQSEVKLINNPDALSSELQIVDHSVVTLPVHKVIAEVFLNHMLPLLKFSTQKNKTTKKKTDALESIRLLMIGAGGCVLPSHILHNLESQQQQHTLVPRVVIDAVEPDSEIIMAAEKYFDAKFNDQLIPHVIDGATFLHNHNRQTRLGRGGVEFTSYDEVFNYDVIVIDAFEPIADSSNAHSVHASSKSRAPPLSLIEQSSEVTSALKSLSDNKSSSTSSTSSSCVVNGLVIINVFGDKTWLLKTMSQYNISNGFCKPIVIVIGNSEVVSENNYVLITTPLNSDDQTKKATTEDKKSNFIDEKALKKTETLDDASRPLYSISSQTSCARLEEISHSLTSSLLFSHQVVNDGIIFVYNSEEL